MSQPHTIVLADDGGAAAVAVLEWLRSTTGAAVVTVTTDLGQEDDLEAIRDRALAAGALRAHVIDCRAVFAREFLLPALKADADLPAAAWSALAWPVLARTLVDVAAMEGTSTVAHALVPGTQESAHLEAAVRALGPDLLVVAAGSASGAYTQGSRTGRSTTHPAVPEESACVAIAFARGVPTSLNGIEMSLEDLLVSLGTIAGAYTRRGAAAEAYSPTSWARLQAIATLATAHQALRRAVTDARLDALCDVVGREYGALVTGGEWFTAARRALDGFAGEVQTRISGTVRFRLSARGLEEVTISTPFARADVDARVTSAPASSGQPIGL